MISKQRVERENSPNHKLWAICNWFCVAFPDLRFNFTDFEERGYLIHCTGQETGTHQGVLDLKPFWMPITLPPTRKSFKLPKSVYILQVAGDKVTFYGEEATQGGGLAGILEKLGVKIPYRRGE
jgi:hypothetical protein